MTREQWFEAALDARQRRGLPRTTQNSAILRQAAVILRPVLGEQEGTSPKNRPKAAK